MPRYVSAHVQVAALALFAAGCGGAGESDRTAPARAQPAPPKPPAISTLADLVSEAQAICARLEERISHLGRPATPPTRKQILALIAAWKVTVDELHALEPPPREARRFGRMLVHFDNAIRAAEALPPAKGEIALVHVAAMAYAGQRGAAIARAYGLDRCSLFPPAPTRAEFEQYVLSRAESGVPLAPRGGKLVDPPRRP
jgi:hypothetical protein